MLLRLKDANTSELVSKLTGEVLLELTKAVTSAGDKVHKKSENLLPDGKRIRRLKPWWDKTLSKLHEDVCKVYVQYRDSGFDEELRVHFQNVKRNYRKYRRFREQEHNNLKLKELN